MKTVAACDSASLHSVLLQKNAVFFIFGFPFWFQSGKMDPFAYFSDFVLKRNNERLNHTWIQHTELLTNCHEVNVRRYDGISTLLMHAWHCYSMCCSMSVYI